MGKIHQVKQVIAHALVAVLVTLALSSIIGCPPPPRFRSGYADYWVEFYDYVYDAYGRVSEAYCANVVTFYGDIDYDCSSYPMVWSYAENNWMSCSYIDSRGFTRYYDDYYYFAPGYVQEPACYGSYNSSLPPSSYSRTGDSIRDRNEDGQMELPDGVELPEEMQEETLQQLRERLLEDPELREQLRERIRRYIEENGIPDGLTGDDEELRTDRGSTTRLTEPVEGDPPGDSE